MFIIFVNSKCLATISRLNLKVNGTIDIFYSTPKVHSFRIFCRIYFLGHSLPLSNFFPYGKCLATSKWEACQRVKLIFTIFFQEITTKSGENFCKSLEIPSMGAIWKTFQSWQFLTHQLVTQSQNYSRIDWKHMVNPLQRSKIGSKVHIKSIL